MRKSYPYTFNDWLSGECSTVKKLDRSVLGDNYQSEYVTMYNYITDRGWFRKDGRWISPHSGNSVRKIADAYYSQKYREMINDRTR